MPHQPQGNEPYPKLLDWLRYVCAFLLYMYGVSKLAHLQFNLTSQLSQRTISSLSGYELTWYYYGYSRIYASILGLTQLTGATLLLFRKTTLLGALTMFPIMANILLINMFILVNDYGPFFTSSLILFSMLLILWNQRAALLSLFLLTQKPEAAESSRTHRWIRLSIVLAVCAIMISGLVMQHFVRR
jgi:hypothetical protein